MASNSISDLIGGKDDDPLFDANNSGAIRGPDSVDGLLIEDVDTLTGEDIVDPVNELWLKDFFLANNIFAYVSMSKLVVITFMYLIWYLAGTRLSSYYHVTWLTSLLAIYIADIPVVVSWYYLY